MEEVESLEKQGRDIVNKIYLLNAAVVIKKDKITKLFEQQKVYWDKEGLLLKQKEVIDVEMEELKKKRQAGDLERVGIERSIREDEVLAAELREKQTVLSKETNEVKEQVKKKAKMDDDDSKHMVNYQTKKTTREVLRLFFDHMRAYMTVNDDALQQIIDTTYLVRGVIRWNRFKDKMLPARIRLPKEGVKFYFYAVEEITWSVNITDKEQIIVAFNNVEDPVTIFSMANGGFVGLL